MDQPSSLDRAIRFFLERKLVVFLLVGLFAFWGVVVAPFDWEIPGLPRHPVAVDAIPDIGENQQIVFTDWPGRSPQDVEDQISYPLTAALLGLPSVRTVRSYSMFGFSMIYIIFKEDVEFYWSRSRILEKLASLPAGLLPEGVRPALGPDATALGQVFWYTLEGRDPQGQPAGGWDLQELRTIQDWQVRYALQSVDGVSEVASVGGFVQEYQVDVDPDAMRAWGVSLEDVYRAVRMSNIDVGAQTIEVNRVEYLIRGIGFIKSVSDLENAVIKASGGTPVYVRNVAHVALGPQLRTGALDKEGSQAVGGVVVVRYGENPLHVIKGIKQKIAEISAGLPEKTLPDGRRSKVTIVPFYDRTGLIHETLQTLKTALTEEILVTIIVILVMVMHLRSSLLISSMLPLSVLVCFIAMKQFGVDANIVALSGIAIAIGTIVDMGIVVCENILKHLHAAGPEQSRLEVVYRGVTEVGSAVLTAVSTTVVGFLPVFTMQGAEGKLFRPLAFTKTFALVASILVALFVLPALAHLFSSPGWRKRGARRAAGVVLAAGGLAVGFFFHWLAGGALIVWGAWLAGRDRLPERVQTWALRSFSVLAAVAVVGLLAADWSPAGPERGWLVNFLFVALAVGGLLIFFLVFQWIYPCLLRWFLAHKAVFLLLPAAILMWGGLVWLGAPRLLGWLPAGLRTAGPGVWLMHHFPGLGREFMPPLDEGAYLWMPTVMPHASIGEALEVIATQDKAISAIPEVASAVGKIGRVDSALDPAPLSMIETVINYHPQFLEDDLGRRLTFAWDGGRDDLFRSPAGDPILAPDGQPYTVAGAFERDEQGRLVPDPDGKPFRLWRPALDPALNSGRLAWSGIQQPDDIWDLIVRAARLPGVTSAPRLQPINARIVMLQSGMRAPMGLKVKGPDLKTIEAVGLQIEKLLRQVPSVQPETVNADRIVGKPYLEIAIDRPAIARYGLMLEQVQQVIEVAIGGQRITTTVEGRERYPVRVRYLRELRDSLEKLGSVLVPTPSGAQIPLRQLAEIQYVRGPQMIKSEDTTLVGYVLFDMMPGHAEVDVVEQCRAFLQEKIASGELVIPAGVSFTFAGNYENQLRAQQRLRIVLPLALVVIFLILYFQFSRVGVALMVFSSIFVAWAGGFVMLWLYGQGWFMDFSVLGVNLRELFGMGTVNLSVAVWVGFLALFGIASDDGVIIATYIKQTLEREPGGDVAAVREAVVRAGSRRIRPCLMTVATTVLALLPVLTSTGRGSDVMVPMAIPSFGGMVFVLISMFIVPVLYCLIEELKLRWRASNASTQLD